VLNSKIILFLFALSNTSHVTHLSSMFFVYLSKPIPKLYKAVINYFVLNPPKLFKHLIFVSLTPADWLKQNINNKCLCPIMDVRAQGTLRNLALFKNG